MRAGVVAALPVTAAAAAPVLHAVQGPQRQAAPERGRVPHPGERIDNSTRLQSQVTVFGDCAQPRRATWVSKHTGTLLVGQPLNRVYASS